MKVQVQGLTRYPFSLKWKIQTRYYMERGAQAWLSGEVPSDININPRAAYQAAMLVYHSVRESYPHGVPARQKIYILEIAAGLGNYYLNFRRSFASICRTHGKHFHEQMVYVMTDFAPQTLREAESNAHLRQARKRGELELYVLDAIKLDEMRDLDGKKYDWLRKKPVAVIGNYVHCVLPVTILKKQGKSYLEEYISLSLELRRRLSPQAIRKIVHGEAEPTLLKHLHEKDVFRRTDIKKYVTDRAARVALEATTRNMDDVLFVFPFGSLVHIKSMLPRMRRNGIMLISDKGYAGVRAMLKPRNVIPSLHGNSFAHNVNFPLLERYAREIKSATALTLDSPYAVQMLMIARSRRLAAPLVRAFHELYSEHNYNEKALSWAIAARSFILQEEWQSAISYITRALKYRTDDYLLLTRLGYCYFQLRKYSQALKTFTRAKRFDYFSQAPLDFAIALVRATHLKKLPALKRHKDFSLQHKQLLRAVR
jgi:tetratricopeptide (TPR) repeat protein